MWIKLALLIPHCGIESLYEPKKGDKKKQSVSCPVRRSS